MENLGAVQVTPKPKFNKTLISISIPFLLVGVGLLHFYLFLYVWFVKEILDLEILQILQMKFFLWFPPYSEKILSLSVSFSKLKKHSLIISSHLKKDEIQCWIWRTKLCNNLPVWFQTV